MAIGKFSDVLEDYIALHGNSGASVVQILHEFQESDSFRHSRNQFLGSLYYLIQNNRVSIGKKHEKPIPECGLNSDDINEFFSHIERALDDPSSGQLCNVHIFPSESAIERFLGAFDVLGQLGPTYLTVLEEISKAREEGVTITQLRAKCNTQLHQMHYITNTLLERYVNIDHLPFSLLVFPMSYCSLCRNLIIKASVTMSNSEQSGVSVGHGHTSGGISRVIPQITKYWLPRFAPKRIRIELVIKDLSRLESLLDCVPSSTLTVHDLARILGIDSSRLSQLARCTNFLPKPSSTTSQSSLLVSDGALSLPLLDNSSRNPAYISSLSRNELVHINASHTGHGASTWLSSIDSHWPRALEDSISLKGVVFHDRSESILSKNAFQDFTGDLPALQRIRMRLCTAIVSHVYPTFHLRNSIQSSIENDYRLEGIDHTMASDDSTLTVLKSGIDASLSTSTSSLDLHQISIRNDVRELHNYCGVESNFVYSRPQSSQMDAMEDADASLVLEDDSTEGQEYVTGDSPDALQLHSTPALPSTEHDFSKSLTQKPLDQDATEPGSALIRGKDPLSVLSASGPHVTKVSNTPVVCATLGDAVIPNRLVRANPFLASDPDSARLPFELSPFSDWFYFHGRTASQTSQHVVPYPDHTHGIRNRSESTSVAIASHAVDSTSLPPYTATQTSTEAEFNAFFDEVMESLDAPSRTDVVGGTQLSPGTTTTHVTLCHSLDQSGVLPLEDSTAPASMLVGTTALHTGISPLDVLYSKTYKHAPVFPPPTTDAETVERELGFHRDSLWDQYLEERGLILPRELDRFQSAQSMVPNIASHCENSTSRAETVASVNTVPLVNESEGNHNQASDGACDRSITSGGLANSLSDSADTRPRSMWYYPSVFQASIADGNLCIFESLLLDTVMKLINASGSRGISSGDLRSICGHRTKLSTRVQNIIRDYNLCASSVVLLNKNNTLLFYSCPEAIAASTERNTRPDVFSQIQVMSTFAETGLPGFLSQNMKHISSLVSKSIPSAMNTEKTDAKLSSDTTSSLPLGIQSFLFSHLSDEEIQLVCPQLKLPSLVTIPPFFILSNVPAPSPVALLPDSTIDSNASSSAVSLSEIVQDSQPVKQEVNSTEGTVDLSTKTTAPTLSSFGAISSSATQAGASPFLNQLLQKIPSEIVEAVNRAVGQNRTMQLRLLMVVDYLRRKQCTATFALIRYMHLQERVREFIDTCKVLGVPAEKSPEGREIYRIPHRYFVRGMLDRKSAHRLIDVLVTLGLCKLQFIDLQKLKVAVILLNTLSETDPIVTNYCESITSIRNVRNAVREIEQEFLDSFPLDYVQETGIAVELYLELEATSRANFKSPEELAKESRTQLQSLDTNPFVPLSFPSASDPSHFRHYPASTSMVLWNPARHIFFNRNYLVSNPQHNDVLDPGAESEQVNQFLSSFEWRHDSDHYAVPTQRRNTTVYRFRVCDQVPSSSPLFISSVVLRVSVSLMLPARYSDVPLPSSHTGDFAPLRLIASDPSVVNVTELLLSEDSVKESHAGVSAVASRVTLLTLIPASRRILNGNKISPAFRVLGGLTSLLRPNDSRRHGKKRSGLFCTNQDLLSRIFSAIYTAKSPRWFQDFFQPLPVESSIVTKDQTVLIIPLLAIHMVARPYCAGFQRHINTFSIQRRQYPENFLTFTKESISPPTAAANGTLVDNLAQSQKVPFRTLNFLFRLTTKLREAKLMELLQISQQEAANGVPPGSGDFQSDGKRMPKYSHMHLKSFLDSRNLSDLLAADSVFNNIEDLLEATKLPKVLEADKYVVTFADFDFDRDDSKSGLHLWRNSDIKNLISAYSRSKAYSEKHEQVTYLRNLIRYLFAKKVHELELLDYQANLEAYETAVRDMQPDNGEISPNFVRDDMLNPPSKPNAFLFPVPLLRSSPVNWKRIALQLGLPSRFTRWSWKKLKLSSNPNYRDYLHNTIQRMRASYSVCLYKDTPPATEPLEDDLSSPFSPGSETPSGKSSRKRLRIMKGDVVQTGARDGSNMADDEDMDTLATSQRLHGAAYYLFPTQKETGRKKRRIRHQTSLFYRQRNHFPVIGMSKHWIRRCRTSLSKAVIIPESRTSRFHLAVRDNSKREMEGGQRGQYMRRPKKFLKLQKICWKEDRQLREEFGFAPPDALPTNAYCVCTFPEVSLWELQSKSNFALPPNASSWSFSMLPHKWTAPNASNIWHSSQDLRVALYISRLIQALIPYDVAKFWRKEYPSLFDILYFSNQDAHNLTSNYGNANDVVETGISEEPMPNMNIYQYLPFEVLNALSKDCYWTLSDLVSQSASHLASPRTLSPLVTGEASPNAANYVQDNTGLDRNGIHNCSIPKSSLLPSSAFTGNVYGQETEGDSLMQNSEDYLRSLIPLASGDGLTTPLCVFSDFLEKMLQTNNLRISSSMSDHSAESNVCTISQSVPQGGEGECPPNLVSEALSSAQVASSATSASTNNSSFSHLSSQFPKGIGRSIGEEATSPKSPQLRHDELKRVVSLLLKGNLRLSTDFNEMLFDKVPTSVLCRNFHDLVRVLDQSGQDNSFSKSSIGNEGGSSLSHLSHSDTHEQDDIVTSVSLSKDPLSTVLPPISTNSTSVLDTVPSILHAPASSPSSAATPGDALHILCQSFVNPGTVRFVPPEHTLVIGAQVGREAGKKSVQREIEADVIGEEDYPLIKTGRWDERVSTFCNMFHDLSSKLSITRLGSFERTNLTPSTSVEPISSSKETMEILNSTSDIITSTITTPSKNELLRQQLGQEDKDRKMEATKDKKLKKKKKKKLTKSEKKKAHLERQKELAKRNSVHQEIESSDSENENEEQTARTELLRLLPSENHATYPQHDRNMDLIRPSCDEKVGQVGLARSSREQSSNNGPFTTGDLSNESKATDDLTKAFLASNVLDGKVLVLQCDGNEGTNGASTQASKSKCPVWNEFHEKSSSLPNEKFPITRTHCPSCGHKWKSTEHFRVFDGEPSFGIFGRHPCSSCIFHFCMSNCTSTRTLLGRSSDWISFPLDHETGLISILRGKSSPSICFPTKNYALGLLLHHPTISKSFSQLQSVLTISEDFSPLSAFDEYLVAQPNPPMLLSIPTVLSILSTSFSNLLPDFLELPVLIQDMLIRILLPTISQPSHCSGSSSPSLSSLTSPPTISRQTHKKMVASTVRNRALLPLGDIWISEVFVPSFTIPLLLDDPTYFETPGEFPPSISSLLTSITHSATVNQDSDSSSTLHMTPSLSVPLGLAVEKYPLRQNIYVWSGIQPSEWCIHIPSVSACLNLPVLLSLCLSVLSYVQEVNIIPESLLISHFSVIPPSNLRILLRWLIHLGLLRRRCFMQRTEWSEDGIVVSNDCGPMLRSNEDYRNPSDNKDCEEEQNAAKESLFSTSWNDHFRSSLPMFLRYLPLSMLVTAWEYTSIEHQDGTNSSASEEPTTKMENVHDLLSLLYKLPGDPCPIPGMTTIYETTGTSIHDLAFFFSVLATDRPLTASHQRV